MEDLKESITDDNLKLVESINSRVNSIYKQLCEFEDCIDPNTSEDFGDSYSKIMDILETLEYIQEGAQMIRPCNLSLHSHQQSLDEQIKCLEQSVHLLKLSKKPEDMGEQ
ncbi:uncharacterized protein LOC142228942 [Haematobia irritans]|uniref:uncharacterized protein LOC142228942 n=1 Tax=Haematobia irritans TaxID=7368 RepID=UPI003F50B1E8